MKIVDEIDALVERLIAEGLPGPSGLWPSMRVAVRPADALAAIGASGLAKFLPAPGENLGRRPGDKQYPMPEQPTNAWVEAESLGPFDDGSGLRSLALCFGVPGGRLLIGCETAYGVDGVPKDNVYVYDRIWLADYAETGYEDGHTRIEGVNNKRLAKTMVAIINDLIAYRN